MKKRRPIGIFDLGRIPVTPVQREESVGTLKQYRERLVREEQEAAAAEQRRFEATLTDFNQTLRELNKSQKQLTHELWGRPLDCIDNPASWSGDLAVDPTIGLQDAATKFDIQTDASNLRAVAVEFELNSKELTGYTLNEDGAKRLLYFAFAQAIHGKDLTAVAAWVTCFERLLECNCFDDGEIQFHHAKKVTPQPRPEPEQPHRATMDDLMNVNAETREGQRQARDIGEELYIEEFLRLATEWVESIQRHWGFSPTPDELRRVSRWFETNNLNRLTPRNYDLARLWLIKNGYWPESCRTAVEALNAETEQMDLTRMTHDDRRMLNVRVAQARESDARRFGHSQ